MMKNLDIFILLEILIPLGTWTTVLARVQVPTSCLFSVLFARRRKLALLHSFSVSRISVLIRFVHVNIYDVPIINLALYLCHLSPFTLLCLFNFVKIVGFINVVKMTVEDHRLRENESAVCYILDHWPSKRCRVSC